MAAEAEVLDELHRLRARVPQLTGALAASVDGLVLAHDTPGVEPEGLAALTAAALGVAVRMTDAAGRGELRELLLRGDHGYVATYAAGSTAVLTLLAQDRVNVGRLHLEGRRAGGRIGELMDALPRPDDSAAAGARAAARNPARSVARTANGTQNGTPNGTPAATEPQTPAKATVRSTMPRRTPRATTPRPTPRTTPNAPTTSES
ncbi:roadblock/LC7 domain-containing protein [Streptomyces caniscabiei]|uniref:Roadblock/LC7 domain-containing protein n=2 Tax=Streptomyces caniscabiei TaxID=2746961 RepID=A0A927L9B1_9ACTN|nr:roadblock/LC7 domain-containing protein [Streptomyces caniscabiei]MBD9727131.1 roadblock/LC7 domain-containing protein [Streptomyces caniscabiei]MDX3512161.1 roadblock/LC7 domain-containing protein [Streptomyces caniscabiei]MDX3721412.1 roadblock/LC7 domain-containing protein [Streptomyces caniscabiei]WEO26502.1 roadblock/LC7 domain-containing protein [Streptomyces caniscabiei]